MSFKQIRLLEQQEKEYFLDCVDELYGTIAQDTSFKVIRKRVKYSRTKNWVVRALSKFGILRHVRLRLSNESVINFASMISGDFKLFLPYAFFSRHNYIYMYDTWPRFQKWIFPLLDFLSIRFVFFSSKQVYEDHLNKCPQSRCKSMWIPEAIDAHAYRFEHVEDKDIDVLEFGRIYQAHHELIEPALAANGKKHVYRQAGMPLLFPDRTSFIRGLARSKIVICVPSNITHPERAEYISTMTLRYLQAMASKVLIVGIMPSDMRELFPYVPIVEIDMARAAGQILNVFDNYEQYRYLIERNYKEVRQNHQWQNRWAVIKSVIEETYG